MHCHFIFQTFNFIVINFPSLSFISQYNHFIYCHPTYHLRNCLTSVTDYYTPTVTLYSVHTTLPFLSLTTHPTFSLLSHFTHRHPYTQLHIAPLSHLCRIYYNTFFLFALHTFHFHSLLTTLILHPHTTSFTFSLQSIYNTQIFTFHLHLTFAIILLVSHNLVLHFAHTTFTLHLYLTGRLPLPFLHTSLLNISQYSVTHLKLLFETHFQFAVFISLFYLFSFWKLMFHFQPNHFIFIYTKKLGTYLHSFYFSSIRGCCVDSLLVNLPPYHYSILINKL